VSPADHHKQQQQQQQQHCWPTGCLLAASRLPSCANARCPGSVLLLALTCSTEQGGVQQSGPVSQGLEVAELQTPHDGPATESNASTMQSCQPAPCTACRQSRLCVNDTAALMIATS
jgi:hypothetical protein